MNHYLNHHQRVKVVIDQFGIAGYGAYWILNELISSSPNKSMPKSEVLKKTNGLIPKEMAVKILDNKELFYCSGDWYLTELERKHDLSVEGAYLILDKAGLRGRGFSRIMNVNSIGEKDMMKLFEEWKQANENRTFNNEDHVFKSFNYYVNTRWKGKKQNDIDWSRI